MKTDATIAYTLNGQDVSFGPGVTLPATPADRPCFARWAKLATALFEKGEVKPLQVTNVGNLEDVPDALTKLMKGEHSEKMVASVP